MISGAEPIFPLQFGIACKVVATGLNLLGVAMVAFADEHDPDGKDTESGNSVEQSIIGDILALGSSVCYAAYTVLLDRHFGNDQNVDIMVLFGWLGA